MRSEALKWLIKTYPKTFVITDIKPLKTGIHLDILKANAAGVPSNAELRKALKYYTNSTSYLFSLTHKNMYRIDLAGYRYIRVQKEDVIEAKRRIKIIIASRKEQAKAKKQENAIKQYNKPYVPTLNPVFRTGLKPLLSLKKK